jgi:hypothetical protein
MKMGNTVHPLGAKNADERPFEWNYGAVEDARHVRQRPTANDRIRVVTPDNVSHARRLWLPRDVGNRWTSNR